MLWRWSLFATTGDAFVRVGARPRLQGSGAQCLALDGDTVYVGCRGGGLKRSADGGDSARRGRVPGTLAPEKLQTSPKRDRRPASLLLRRRGSSAPGTSELHATRRGASRPEPTEEWASRYAERPAIRGEPQIRTFQRDVQLESPLGSPSP